MVVTQTELLNTVEDMIIIDLSNYICLLNDELMDSLVDPEIGVYKRGSIIPRISLRNNVYFESDKTKPITNPELILERKENIVSSSGEILLSGNEITVCSKQFSSSPFIHPTAISLAKGIIDNYIFYLTCKTGYGKGLTQLEEFVKPEKHYLIRQDEYFVVLQPMLDLLSDFVEKHTTHIYYTRLRSSSLFIERMCDYRVVEYYRLLEELNSIKHRRTTI